MKNPGSGRGFLLHRFLGIRANTAHCAPLPETAPQRWLSCALSPTRQMPMITITAEQARANADAAIRPIEQYYSDLDKSIQVGSENGRRYIVFGFSQALASERLVDGVVEQLLKNRFHVERLPSDAEQHFIRISWDGSEPVRLNDG
ncbi:MAG: hypothetical protein RR704_03745 [Stenotrophomonas sp.]